VTWQAGFHRRGFRWMKPWVHAETGNLFSSQNNNNTPEPCLDTFRIPKFYILSSLNRIFGDMHENIDKK
jgi:hypothetical protein